MQFNEKHATIILQRIYNCKDEFERVDLVSRIDKQRIPIHRVILSATRNHYAASLRTIGLREKPKEFLLDSSGETIKTFVDYCYTGQVTLTEKNVESCLKIAIYIEVDSLLSKCHDYYLKKLSTENVVEFLSIADKYNLRDLQRRASELLCIHLEQVPTINIHQLNAATMLHLMKVADETISIDLFINRLLSWLYHDVADRGEHMPKILRLIRLEKLTLEFLCETIEPLFKRFKCIELLSNEFKRRAMHNAPCCNCLPAKDDNAATSDKTAILNVTQGLEFDENNQFARAKMNIERYDESLKKFTHFTSQVAVFLSHSVLYENKMFTSGGVDVRGLAINSMIAYDLKTEIVEKLQSMNERRYEHTSIAMGKSIYVFGGHNGKETLRSCERYDIEKGTWQSIKPMNHNRFRVCLAILDDKIYVIGGSDDRTQRLTAVESYDPKTDEWTERMPLEVKEGKSLLVAFNGMLYAFLDDHAVREYDPERNVWKEFQANYVFRSVISANGKLLAITEGGSFGYLTVNERERKIDFAKREEIDIVAKCEEISMQHFRFENNSVFLFSDKNIRET